LFGYENLARVANARYKRTSKNKDQFDDPEYLSCYKKKAKGQLTGMEALGWVPGFYSF
jgi:hypothetical protein